MSIKAFIRLLNLVVKDKKEKMIFVYLRLQIKINYYFIQTC